MKLTAYSDYTLRLLIYLGSQPEGQLSNIKEVSKLYGISTNHLSKIVFNLGKMGLLTTIRGKNGGFKLAKKPAEINIGWVIRQTEEDLDIVECFNEHRNQCILTPHCRLKHVFNDAISAFLKVLDEYTLDQFIVNENVFKGD